MKNHRSSKLVKFPLYTAAFAALLFCALSCEQASSSDGSGGTDISKVDNSFLEPPKYAVEINGAADLRQKITANPGGTYHLANDIEVSDWIPLCSDTPFSGRFYGMGKTITINSGSGGIFYSLNSATVRDLAVKVTADVESGYGGGIAAYAEKSLIINCKASVTLTVNGDSHNVSAGGIVGYMRKYSTVSSCTVQGSIKLSSDTGSGLMVYAGGIVGYAGTGLAGEGLSGCVIEISSWDGDVNVTGGYPYAGGVVGYNYTGAVVRRCSARGTVTSYGGNLPYAGGIAGYNSGYGNNPSSIENCYSKAVVRAESLGKSALAGGVAGANAAGALISKCWAQGAVTAQVTGTGTENIGDSVGVLKAVNAGGIAGAQYVTRTTMPTITACAAFNTSVNGMDKVNDAAWNVYRIAGAGSEGNDTGVFKNNIAYSNMTVQNHAASWFKTDSGKDGKDTELEPAQSVYTAMGWDFSAVWIMSGGYPTLR
jgi:hypothetical protein